MSSSTSLGRTTAVSARLARQVPMALMAEADGREVSHLRADVTAALETLVHPRYVAQAQPILGVACAGLYYGLSLLSPAHSTPGQGFSDLLMVRELEAVPSQAAAAGPVFGKPSDGRYAATAALMALLPALGELWGAYGPAAVQQAVQLLDTVASDDGDAAVLPAVSAEADVVVVETEAAAAEEEGGSTAAGALHALQQRVADSAAAIPGRLALALRGAAVEVCAQLNSDDARDGGAGSAVRQAALLAVDVHSLLWLTQGLYYHVSLRLTGVNLMQQIRPRGPPGSRGRGEGVREVSLRALRWVLALRLALLGGNAVALIAKHWRRTAPAAEGAGPAAGIAAPVADTDAAADAARRNLAQERAQERRLRIAGMEGRACPLCMDSVRCPAVTPCGHVYCWACIQGLCVRAEAPGSGYSAAALAQARSKCPVCRKEFEARQVRAIM